jgi:hypothetical protein
MPELSYTKSTSPHRLTKPVAWCVNQTQLALLDEWFNVSYYRNCLKAVEFTAPIRDSLNTIFGKLKGTEPETLARIAAQTKDVVRWAAECRQQDYHRIHASGLIGLWAAQEAGVENLISEVIRTNRAAAHAASQKFKANRYPMHSWPWSNEICLEIAQKLDIKAKEATEHGGTRACARIQTLLGWFGLEPMLSDESVPDFDEAAYTRNLIVHRYGVVSGRDAELFPNFRDHIGSVLPISSQMLQNYYTAMNELFIAIGDCVAKSEYN